MSLAAIFAAYIVSKWIFKMPLFAALGATTGAMTSAPALNALFLYPTMTELHLFMLLVNR